jgi:hypothetical protein
MPIDGADTYDDAGSLDRHPRGRRHPATLASREILADPMDATTTAVHSFLLRASGRPICVECLTRATGIGQISRTRRALRGLSKAGGLRVDETECGSCGRTRLTVAALWRGI